MYSLLVPAAGEGARLGSSLPKAFVPIEVGGINQTIIEWALDPFHSDAECERIVVAVPNELIDSTTELLERFQKVSVVGGGATRQDSVRLALHFLQHCLGGRDEEIVLVHDAARCAVSPLVICEVVSAVLSGGAATAAVKVVDALVNVNESSEIVAEIPRETVWGVQTPQGFLIRDLSTAHEDAVRSGVTALDDASLVRRLRDVVVVSGSQSNIKVTYPGDIATVSQALLVRMGR